MKHADLSTQFSDVPRALVKAARGRVYYDAECPLCLRLLARYGAPFRTAGFGFEPLQGASGPFAPEEFRSEMKLFRADGLWFGGVGAWAELFRAVWWLRPLAWILLAPGVRRLAARVYSWVAANRYCLGGNCAVNRSSAPDRWVPLVVLPSAVFLAQPLIEPWLFMWLMAFVLYAGCKWLTYRDASAASGHPRGWAAVGYLLLWPGMDARRWKIKPDPDFETGLGAVLRVLLGVGLIWVAVPLVAADAFLLRGWLGMVGIVMMLHFGLFHLLSIGWRASGYNAMPIMSSPARARTLTEFWGRRWNRAFHDLAVRYLFKPMQRRFGPRAGVLAAFLASGLAHELVISVPARGGFGGPTFYFLLQGAGVLLEKTSVGAFLGMGRGIPGRVWTGLFTILPVPLLFPPVFVERIILPMMHALGAT